MRFDKFPISEQIKKNLEQMKFFRTTDIQYKAIPSILKGEDVMAIAQTGTGKTAAFAIPIIDMLHQKKSSSRSQGIRCLVMVPTRELALQIGEVFHRLERHTKVKTFSLHGGVEQDHQISRLEDGIDILIATPGRMFDLISQGFVDLERIQILVLDEADQMLDLGFIKDIESVKRKLTRRHQTLFFSATINTKIKKLAFSQVKQSAIRIQISPKDPVSKNVSHALVAVEMDDKRFALEEFIKHRPEGKFIVFVRTRVRAERVHLAMKRVGIETLTLHGEKEQTERSQVLKAFRDGECQVMVATDVSARGIDIPDVTHVINYDLPEKPENYVHRVGRTGRGFNKGQAVSFVSSTEKLLLDQIQALLPEKIKTLARETQEPEIKIDESLSFSEMIENEENRIEREKRKKKRKS